MSEPKTSSGGIGFCGMLTIAFIVLKLCGVITWSWWWVVSPIWIPLSIGALAFIVWAIIQIKKKQDTKARLQSGYNELGWKNGGKSKWQQRMDKMQEAEKRRANP